VPHVNRRATLKGMLGLGLAAVGTAATRPVSAAPPVALAMARSQASATPVPDGLIGYAFNAKTQNVTLFDPITHQVLSTEPLGAVVRWLSNEQRFWDGRYVWTYDFPEDRVQAIGIDPETITVARTVPTDGTGPAHSLMLTPDHKTAWVNVAGDDALAVLDLASGEVIDSVTTGTFP
jgi:DNA-binding beta-propeller fold protein YncE